MVRIVSLVTCIGSAAATSDFFHFPFDNATTSEQHRRLEALQSYATYGRRLAETGMDLPEECATTCGEKAKALEADFKKIEEASKKFESDPALAIAHMGDMIACMFEVMCAAKDALTCLQETDACKPLFEGDDAKQFKEMVDGIKCVCDDCPGMGQALAGTMQAVMEGMMAGLSENPPSEEEATKAMMEGVCPLHDPAVCAQSKDSCTVVMEGEMGAMAKQDMAVFKTGCDAAGAPLKPAAGKYSCKNMGVTLESAGAEDSAVTASLGCVAMVATVAVSTIVV